MTTSPAPDDTAGPQTPAAAAGSDLSRQASALSPGGSPLMSAQNSWAAIHSPDVEAAAGGGGSPASSCNSDDDVPAPARFPLNEDMALDPRLMARVIRSWLDTSVCTAAPSGCYQMDVLTLRHLPPTDIEAFLQRVFQYTACEPVCFSVALALIHRLRINGVALHAGCCTRVPGEPCACSGQAFVVHKFNIFRLIGAAVTLAIKSTQDVYHPMHFYGAVFGVSATDLRRMEVSLMTLLDHRLYVNREFAEEAVASGLQAERETRQKSDFAP